MDINNLYPSSGAATPATSKDSTSTSIISTVRKAAAGLLPYLLISPPFLPSEVKSSELNLRHSMLSITSEDADQYLVTAHTAHSQDEDVGTKVISLLDQIRSLAEGLGQENDDENGGAIKLVGKVLFSEPEKGKILASVELGDQDETSSNKSSLLSLHLKHETSEESSTGSDRKGYKIVPNWKYDNLLPSTSTASTGQQWSSTFPETSSTTMLTSSNADNLTVDSYDTAGSAGFESARDDSDEATEEASRPGEYHTNADDFWGGYDEEEDKATSKDADQVKESTEEETDEAKAEREKKEEQEVSYLRIAFSLRYG